MAKKRGIPREIKAEDFPVEYGKLLKYAEKKSLIISRFYIVEGGNTGSHVKAELKKDLNHPFWVNDYKNLDEICGRKIERNPSWWRMVYINNRWSTWG